MPKDGYDVYTDQEYVLDDTPEYSGSLLSAELQGLVGSCHDMDARQVYPWLDKEQVSMKLKLYLLKLYFYKPRVLIRVLNIQRKEHWGDIRADLLAASFGDQT